MADTIKKDIGAVSAYALAVEGGYTGTEEQYKQDMANLARNVTQVANDKAATAESAKTAVAAAAEAQKSAEEAAESAKEAASGGVQSDYAQNDPTAKDYIKNRPGGYEKGWEITWDGDTTGKTCVSADGLPYVFCKVSDIVLTADMLKGGNIAISEMGVTGSDELIKDEYVQQIDIGIVIGEFLISAHTAGTVADFGIDLPEPGTYFVAYVVDGEAAMYVQSVSKKITYPFADKYIPDTIARKNEVYTEGTHLYFYWDGTAGDKDNFQFNARNYYKISDIVVPIESVISAAVAWSNSNKTEGDVFAGTNCYKAADAIIVTAAGDCKIPMGMGSTTEFTFVAPSIGVYLPIINESTGLYIKSLTLVCVAYNNGQGGLIVNSQNKKWAITVDDSGNISAIDITE